MNKRVIGSKAEDKAVLFLENLGYKIIKRNFFTRYGEIDIIAQEDNTFVFVEVKYRKSLAFGSPLEAISSYKIKSICKAARIYLSSLETSARFDIISIIDSKLEHIKNAFDYIY
jgi:putative endonuclease